MACLANSKSSAGSSTDGVGLGDLILFIGADIGSNKHVLVVALVVDGSRVNVVL